MMPTKIRYYKDSKDSGRKHHSMIDKSFTAHTERERKGHRQRTETYNINCL